VMTGGGVCPDTLTLGRVSGSALPAHYVPTPLLWMISCFHIMGPVCHIKHDVMFR